MNSNKLRNYKLGPRVHVHLKSIFLPACLFLILATDSCLLSHSCHFFSSSLLFYSSPFLLFYSSPFYVAPTEDGWYWLFIIRNISRWKKLVLDYASFTLSSFSAPSLPVRYQLICWSVSYSFFLWIKFVKKKYIDQAIK